MKKSTSLWPNWTPLMLRFGCMFAYSTVIKNKLVANWKAVKPALHYHTHTHTHNHSGPEAQSSVLSWCEYPCDRSLVYSLLREEKHQAGKNPGASVSVCKAVSNYSSLPVTLYPLIDETTSLVDSPMHFATTDWFAVN